MPAVILRARAIAGMELAEVRYSVGHYDLTSPSSALEVTLVLRGSVGAVRKDQVIARRPGAARLAVTTRDGAACFVLRVDDGWRSRAVFDAAVPVIATTMKVAGPAESLMRDAHREFAQDDPDSLILEGLLVAALGHVVRAFQPGARPPAPPSVRAALDALHADVEIPRARLGASARVKPAHLAREFRKHVGCSIDQYRRRLRVNAACVLMTDPDCSLTDIALECGFADAAHFSRVFKAITGRSPRAYRATLAMPAHRASRKGYTAPVDPIGRYTFVSSNAAGLRYTGALVIEGSAGAYIGRMSTDIMPDLALDSVAVQGRSLVLTCTVPAGAVVARLDFHGATFTGAWHLGATSRLLRGRRTSAR